MKLLLALAAILLLAAATANPRPSFTDMRATTLRLRVEDGLCSGTAIGPHALLTARHCFNKKLVSVNNIPMQALKFAHEGRDAVVVTVSGEFKHWAKRGGRPIQGDRLRFWGNPVGEPDVYREVLVSRAWTDGIVLQGTICPGDSGAGLMNDRGEVVGIVDAMTGDRVCRFGIGQ